MWLESPEQVFVTRICIDQCLFKGSRLVSGVMVIFNKPSQTRDASARATRERLPAQSLEMASTFFHRPVFCDESKCDQTSSAKEHALLAPVMILDLQKVARTDLVPTIRSKKH